MKKWIAFLLTVFLCTAVCAALAEETSGDFQYLLLEDGSAAITGYTGEGTEITIPAWLDDHPVSAVQGLGAAEPEAVAISYGVKEIGPYAFSGCTSLRQVSIPESVTNIGENAFAGSGLAEVSIPWSVTYIGDCAFESCESLTRAAIYGSLSYLGIGAFRLCPELTAVAIADGLAELSGETFYSCNKLTEVRLPETLEVIGQGDFEYCDALVQIRIPDRVRTIGDGAFEEDVQLAAVTLPAGLETIGSCAFSQCESLKEVRIPDGTTSIGAWAFEKCTALEKVVIPEGVAELGDEVFEEAENAVFFVRRGSPAAKYLIGYGKNIRYDSGDPWLSPEEYEIELAAYGDILDIYSLLEAAETALERGMPQRPVYRAMLEAAKENDLSPQAEYLLENMAAYGSDMQLKLSEMLEEDDREIGIWNASPRVGEGFQSPYSDGDVTECSDAFRAMIADSRAQYNVKPMVWKEEEFASVLGADFSWFTPSGPRPGYVCVVIKRGAEQLPGIVWPNDEYYYGANVSRQAADVAGTMLDEIGSLSQDAMPVLTGNPNLASVFWVYDVRYPQNGTVIRYEDEVPAYDCEVTLTVMDAVSKQKIAELTVRQEVDKERSWGEGDEFIAADIPMLYYSDAFRNGVVRDTAQYLLEAYCVQDAERPITEYNMRTVVNAVLVKQTIGNNDAWQRAVYQAGVGENVELGEDSITFTLRGFDPNLEGAGPYAEAESLHSWLQVTIGSANEYSLQLTLPTANGRLTDEAIETLRCEAAGAAETARNAFASPDMTAALKDWLFTEPLDAEAQAPEDLLTTSERYDTIAASFYYSAEGEPLTNTQRGILNYAVRNLQVDLSGGPHSVVFAGTGLDPAAVSGYGDEIFEEQKYLNYEDRRDAHDAVNLKAAEAAIHARQSGTGSVFSITVDLDSFLRDDLPAEYVAYLKSFKLGTTSERTQERLWQLPFYAAQPFPPNGLMSGGQSGTLIRVQLSGNSSETYIVMREYESDEIRATAFIEPERYVDIRVPAGDYCALYCSGECWYGTEELFGDYGVYQQSEILPIEGGHEYTLTLEAIVDGNVNVWGADPSQFH